MNSILLIDDTKKVREDEKKCLAGKKEDLGVSELHFGESEDLESAVAEWNKGIYSLAIVDGFFPERAFGKDNGIGKNTGLKLPDEPGDFSMFYSSGARFVWQLLMQAEKQGWKDLPVIILSGSTKDWEETKESWKRKYAKFAELLDTVICLDKVLLSSGLLPAVGVKLIDDSGERMEALRQYKLGLFVLTPPARDKAADNRLALAKAAPIAGKEV